MQSEESQKIVGRFFQSIETLKTTGQLRGKKTFCDEMNINRRNLYQLEKNHSRDIFQVSWLTHLITKYGVSADWLLTGRGDMFKKR